MPVRFSVVDHPVYVDLLRNPGLVFRPDSYESDDMPRFIAYVRKRQLKVLFDIGANVGLYTFAFLEASPTGRSVSVVPVLIQSLSEGPLPGLSA